MTQPCSTRLALLASLLLLGTATASRAQLPPPPPPNPGNPLTTAKVNLGKVLFWDEQLSSSRSVACGTCHIPRSGGADPRSATSPLAIGPGADGVFGNADDTFGSPGVPLADANGFYLLSTHFGLGVQATTRRAPSALNSAYPPVLFWDGRATGTFTDPETAAVLLAGGAALEAQSMGPPTSEVEMGHRSRVFSDVSSRLAAAAPLALAPEAPIPLQQWIAGRSYGELFAEAFGSPGITAARIGMAIASYERTLITDATPFDAFLAGDDTALTAQETQGRNVFVAASCDRCHAGPLLSDHSFRYIGVRPTTEDEGRFTVTGNAADHGRMRTPSLRNASLRAPYMHNGRFPDLAAVVEFYDRGGDFTAPNKDPLVRPLALSPADKDALIAFLGRPLTDTRVARGDFPFDRPRLFSESRRAPRTEGSGQPGSGGLEPMVVAVEPALLGNPSFAVGVQNALGGAAALLVIGNADPGLVPPASGSLAYLSIELQGSGTGQGFGSAHFAIPNDPALADQEFFGRWYITDPAGAGGRAVSPVFRFKAFPALAAATVYQDNFESGDTTRWSVTVP